MEIDHSEDLGLRDRKKLRSRAAIIGAASKLFREKGYVDTSLEDIAREADLSPGTVYNYFGTKGAILIAVIDDGDRDFIERQTEVIEQETGNLIEVISRFLEANVTDSLARLPTETWRFAIANSVLDSVGEIESGYRECNKRLYGLLELILQRQIDLGNLPTDFDTATTRELLEMINHALFERTVAKDPFDQQTYRETLGRYLSVVFRNAQN